MAFENVTRVVTQRSKFACEGRIDFAIGREQVEQLRHRFRDWHAPIPTLLDAVSAGAVLYHDLYELPQLETYASGGSHCSGTLRMR